MRKELINGTESVDKINPKYRAQSYTTQDIKKLVDWLVEVTLLTKLILF